MLFVKCGRLKGKGVHKRVFAAALPELEIDLIPDALRPDVQYPAVIQRPCLPVRFSADHDQLHAVQIWLQIHAFNERLRGDALVFDGQRTKYRQLFVRIALVLDRAAHDHVFVAAAPVRRSALREALDAFSQKKEGAVGPRLHHLPAFAAPRVGVLDQKVGRKPDIHQPRLHFIAALLELCHRLVKILRLNDQICVDAPLGVALMNVAVQAALAAPPAPPPRIPPRHRL